MENNLYIPIEYNLENYHPSNQDTSLVHRPLLKEGNWVQPGDILADCSSSENGELSIGQNILIAYMPWEGYNYEDAMLICDRLVYDEIYTSIHIERYEIEIEETPFGLEKITNELSDLPGEMLNHLDRNGLARLGSAVQAGDILVGKITPTEKKVKYSNYEKLLYDILGTKKQNKGKDTSLRVPKGLEATVIKIEIFSENLSFSYSSLNGNLLSLPNPLIYIQKDLFKFLHLQTRKNIQPINNFLENKGLNKFEKISSNLYFLKFIQKMLSTSLKNFRRSSYLNRNKKFFNIFNKINFILVPRSYFLRCGIRKNNHYKDVTLSKLINTTNSKYSNLKNEIKKKKKNQNVLANKNSLKSTLQTHFSSFELFLYEIFICARNKKSYFLTNKIINYHYQNNKLPNSDLIAFKRSSFIKSTILDNHLNFSKISRKHPGAKISFQEQRKKKSKKKYSLIKNQDKLNKTIATEKIMPSLNFLNSKPFKIQIYLAEKRKIQVGDKIAGRHGNKGIVSKILPRQDMPYLADGNPVDLVLNPLGVPSRMNVGQIYECLLGLSGFYLGEYYRILPFDEKVGEEASRSFVFSKLYEARLKTGYSWLFDPKNPGKTFLFDGRTGEKFEQQVTIGYSYILKLVHLVDDKIHCLTSKHEILTDKGWKIIEKCNYKDKIATLDNGFLVYEYPKNIIYYPNYSGKIYQLSTNNIDFNITINHRVWASEYNSFLKNWSNFQHQQIDLLGGKILQYTQTGKWIYKNYKFNDSIVFSLLFIESLKKWNKQIFDFFIQQKQGFLVAKNKKNDLEIKSLFFINSYSWKFFLWIIKVIREKSYSMDIFLILFTIWNNNHNGYGYKNYKKRKNRKTQSSSIISILFNEKSYRFLFQYEKKLINISAIIKSKKILKLFCTKIYNIIQLNSDIEKQKKSLETYYYFLKILIKYFLLKENKKTVQIKYKNTIMVPFWFWLLNGRQCRLYLSYFLFSNSFQIENKFYSLFFNDFLNHDLSRLILHAGWQYNLISFQQLFILEISKLFYNKNQRKNNAKDWKNLFINHNQNGNKQFTANSSIKKHLRLFRFHKNKILFTVKEKIYCIKTSSEIFLTRHNGKIMWTGNSRSTGPYSAVTQQPLRGRSKQGGQRLGEMEVWALEGYGAAFTLLELLTIKSDDKIGRLTIWDSILRQKEISIKTPESFKVLICELKALCFDIKILKKK